MMVGEKLGGRYELRAAAGSIALSQMRHDVRDLLMLANVRSDRIDDLQLVLTEMVANAIDASPSPSSPIEITASIEHSTVVMEVIDSGVGSHELRHIEGRPLPGPSAINGRGLAIIARLSEAVTAIRRGEYTVVRVVVAI